MRFGFCLNMVATGPDKTGAEHLETLSKLGYDYVELPCAELTALSDSEFAAIKEKVSKFGIPCETSNNFFPPSIRLTGPDVDDAKIDAYVEHALSRLRCMGVDKLVFGSGGAKNVPEGFPLDEGYRQIVTLLKRVAPMAAEAGITLVIEPLRTEECNLINTFAEAVRLAKDVDMPNVRVLVDYYHLREMDEPVEHIVKDGRAFLRHVHFARQMGRTCPKTLEEDVNYLPFMRALRDAGYDNRLSCEAYSKNFEDDARQALAFFRKLVAL